LHSLPWSNRIFHMKPAVKKFWLKILFIIAWWLSLFTFAFAQPSEIAIVSKVVDGDTLKIQFQGKEENIRLIGIDCPECRAESTLKGGNCLCLEQYCER